MKQTTEKIERREHRRIAMQDSFIKFVSIELPALNLDMPLPGIVGNLSAGGMTIATFTSIPIGTELKFSIELPDLDTNNLKGRVIRVNNKEGSCLISIAFTEIDEKTKDQINKMVNKFIL